MKNNIYIEPTNEGYLILLGESEHEASVSQSEGIAYIFNSLVNKIKERIERVSEDTYNDCRIRWISINKEGVQVGFRGTYSDGHSTEGTMEMEDSEELAKEVMIIVK